MTLDEQIMRGWADIQARRERHRVPVPTVPESLAQDPTFIRRVEELTPELSQLQMRYAPDARGHTAPAFCVIHLPMTQAHPQRAVELPREPEESGPAFHHRGRVTGLRLAQERGCAPSSVVVHFIDTLPLLAFRDELRTRYQYRWHLLRKGATVDERMWAASAMARLLQDVGHF